VKKDVDGMRFHQKEMYGNTSHSFRGEKRQIYPEPILDAVIASSMLNEKQGDYKLMAENMINLRGFDETFHYDSDKLLEGVKAFRNGEYELASSLFRGEGIQTEKLISFDAVEMYRGERVYVKDLPIEDTQIKRRTDFEHSTISNYSKEKYPYYRYGKDWLGNTYIEVLTEDEVSEEEKKDLI
jgi:hypothetical protein